MATSEVINDHESDSESDIAFATVDFSGVDFDIPAEDADALNATECRALEWEQRIAFGDFGFLEETEKNQEEDTSLNDIRALAALLASGNYVGILRSGTAMRFFEGMSENEGSEPMTIARLLRQNILTKVDSVVSCISYELLAVAAFNLFLQANYTGPSLDETDSYQPACLDGVHPPPCFHELHKLASADNGTELTNDDSKEEKVGVTKPRRKVQYHNRILSELAVDGEWPVQICRIPYFLLLARSILSTIAKPSENSCFWYDDRVIEQDRNKCMSKFIKIASLLHGSQLWNARAVVAHERLLQSRQPTVTLWKEVESSFAKCLELFCGKASEGPDPRAATVFLERGLAEHHFDRPNKGRSSFREAQKRSGLIVEVTGAVGKRTKFQKKATAQMLVRAVSTAPTTDKNTVLDMKQDILQKQAVEHSEDGILLEKIKFEDEKEMEIQPLSVLDQAILLALCLDVKNSNPVDGLTAEEMGAFLARVLDHHDDWMVYSTALLERAWLEFERSHARERAILQIQALADQHTNRLTITQSTLKSVEESAPVQDRLKHLHAIVYPPRWRMVQDLADRYAKLGIVTSAAELYTDIEFWSEVVECYRRAGRVSFAEKIVRERLSVEETPRMWEALGDLTQDPHCYEKAISISRGRYSSAYIALGSYHFEKRALEEAADYYEKGLKIRPLVPAIWFRLGTISMELERWDTALRAFSEVVQQEPEESDAWANVAAIHMRRKRPMEAYPALVESLKYARSNWRVWASKLYTCLDLQKYDEAIQACDVLLDLRAQRQASDGIPPLEERCVRAIVGGTLKAFQASRGEEAKLESSRRTLVRLHALLDRISASSDAEPWIFETMAVFHDQIGHDDQVLDNLMKEYRALQAIPGWEKDDKLIVKMYQVVSHIAHLHVRDGTRESLTKARFIIRGIMQKIQSVRLGDETLPPEAQRLEKLLADVETKYASCEVPQPSL